MFIYPTEQMIVIIHCSDERYEAIRLHIDSLIAEGTCKVSMAHMYDSHYKRLRVVASPSVVEASLREAGFTESDATISWRVIEHD